MMKKVLALLFCLLVFIAVQPVMAGDGNGGHNGGGNNGKHNGPAGDPDQYDIEDMINAIMEQITAAFNQESGQSPLLKITDSIYCVNVDIDLPDTVQITNLLNPTFAEGHFELENCGGNSTIHLDFQLAALINGLSDTIVISEELDVYMTAGQLVSVDLEFPVPPFDAFYELCVTPNSGGVTVTDCAYMMVDGPGGSGVPFAAPGFLLQVGDCVLFSELGDSNAYLNLQYLYGHVPGDTIFVRGILVDDCEFICEEAGGCLLYNSIFPWPDYPSFEGCGTLVQGADCLLFVPLDMGDTAMALEEYGTFIAGDTVYVEGDFVTECDNGCTGAIACIINNTIDTCEIPAPPPFARCGRLVQTTECLLFMPDSYGDSLFILNDYGSFQAGDSVYVEGDLEYGTYPACPQAVGFIDNYLIDSCGTTVFPFYGCGMLIEESTGCLIFTVYDSLRYILDDYGSFGSGDSVYVEGYIYNCQSGCQNVTACIDNSVIETCVYVPPTPIPFEGCGIITDEFDCTLFLAFGLSSGYFVLSDYDGYQIGDSVYVIGDIYPLTDTLECSSTAIRYIEVESLGACPEIPQGTYSGLGILMTEDECLIYYDINDFYTSFVLENYGEFGAFDTVCVSGTIEDTCDFSCNNTVPCLIDNTITYCGYGDTAMVSSADIDKISDVHCYPNPFNPTAQISFNVPTASSVTLEIYNILGQKVQTLIDGEILQGPQTVQWKGDKYASGIYFYRIRTDYDTITKKMVLSK